MPSPRLPPSTICSAEAPRIATEGTRMLPVPRTIEASVLTSQMTIAPGQRDAGIDERLLEHRALSAEHA